jgi:hypothetical protein
MEFDQQAHSEWAQAQACAESWQEEIVSVINDVAMSDGEDSEWGDEPSWPGLLTGEGVIGSDYESHDGHNIDEVVFIFLFVCSHTPEYWKFVFASLCSPSTMWHTLA